MGQHASPAQRAIPGYAPGLGGVLQRTPPALLLAVSVSEASLLLDTAYVSQKAALSAHTNKPVGGVMRLMVMPGGALTVTGDTIEVFATPHADAAATAMTLTLKPEAGHPEAGLLHVMLTPVAVTAHIPHACTWGWCINTQYIACTISAMCN